MNRKQTTVEAFLNRKMFSNPHYDKEVETHEGADTKVDEKSEFDGASFRGETKHEPEKTPEQIAAEESAAAEAAKKEEANKNKTPEEIAKEEALAKETKTAEEKKKNETSTATDSIDDYWDTLSEVVSTSDNKYEVPEFIKTGKKADGTELSKQEKLSLLGSEIIKHSKFSQNEEVNGVIKNMIAASSTDKDFTLSGYIKNLNDQFIDTSNMSNEDKIFNALKVEVGKKDENDTTGLSDEDIKAEVAKMSKIDQVREVRKIDAIQADRINQQTEKYKTDYNKAVEVSFNDWQPKETQILDNFINTIKSQPNIEGFDLSEADKEQFINDLPEFYKNKIVANEEGYNTIQSGVNEVLSEISQNQELAIALTPFLWLVKNNKLKGYTSEIKEKTKKEIEKKFNLSPGGNSSSSTGSSSFDGKSFREGKKS